MKKILALIAVLLLSLNLAAVASAANYPTKSISVICPWISGGGTDAVLHALCTAAGKELGVSLTVENRTGSSGVIGHQAIANAEADGYTLGMITFELSTYAHMGLSDINYESFTPLCLVNTDAAAITVNAAWAEKHGITDVKRFIEYCQANPGKVSMGASSNGGAWHVAGGYLMDAAGIDVRMVPYQEGAATAVQHAASGFIQGVTVSASEVYDFVDSGHLVVLGIMDAQRNSLFPNIPTCAEQGYDINFCTWRGLAIPTDTDPAIVAQLEDAFAAAVQDKAFMSFMAKGGHTIAYKNAADFTAFLKQNQIEVSATLERLGL